VRVLITGAAGLVGTELCRTAPTGTALHGTVRSRPAPSGVTAHAVDVSDVDAVAALLGSVAPDVVVHTAYDKADHEVTVAGARAVAEACATSGAWLVHFSTDALFDGEAAPYTEADRPSPVHAYGRAKAEAERIVRATCPDATVIRTSLVVRADGTDPTSSWVVAALRAGERVALFTDEVRTPVLVEDLATMTWAVVGLGRGAGSGVWHLAGPERLSRAEIGRGLARRLGLDASLVDAVPSPRDGEPRPRDVSLAIGRAADLGVHARPIGSVAAHGQGIG